jgi:hypothetical protein
MSPPRILKALLEDRALERDAGRPGGLMKAIIVRLPIARRPLHLPRLIGIALAHLSDVCLTGNCSR